MKKYRQISRQKANRKIHYLLRMGKPNIEGGATAQTWRSFWKIFFSLRLANHPNNFWWYY